MSIKIPRIVLAAMLLLISSVGYAQNTSFMSVSEVRQGMKGYGKTVFQGSTVEQFNVEVLGVLKNFQPKQDMILVRLSGGPLENTGVIAGMSGSPVYIEGKLLGAVAFAFPFAKEPIAGVQPIGQMLGILDQKVEGQRIAQGSGAPLLESPTSFILGQHAKLAAGKPMHELALPQSMSAANLADAGAAGASLMRIQTPLFISGASPAAIQQFMPFFNAFGFTPVQGGGAGSASSLLGNQASKLEPGSSVNVEMIRGDISYSPNGTVTYVDGRKVYAFGHPNLTAGPTALPMSAGYVISLLPNIQNSFKLAVPLDVVGSFEQDRSTGIAGTLGAQPSMIPVSITMRSSMNSVTKYNFEMANDRFLTPFLLSFTVFSTITATERALGETTLAVSGQIHLKDYAPIDIGNVFSGDVNGPAQASVAAMSPVQYLLMSGFDGVQIERLEFEITSLDRKSNVQLERITVDKSEVRPGETVNLAAYLRGANNNLMVERYAVQIPYGLPAGTVQLLVGDGTTVTTTDLRRGPASVPKDLRQTIKELNNLRKNDRLYIKILSSEPGVMIGGEELPSLPPSMAAVISPDRSSTRSVSNMRNSTVREYELPPSKYVIQGQRSLNLTVVP